MNKIYADIISRNTWKKDIWLIIYKSKLEEEIARILIL